MAALVDHFLICGFGRIGRQVAQEFQAEGIPFLVIDKSADAVHAAQELGYIALQGDITLDATLMEARVQQAKGLIAALPSDAENLYVVLSARTLNPRIRTIARANTEEALQKLQRAGVAHAISPYITGGKRMAAAALRPRVVDFVDGILSGRDRTLKSMNWQPRNVPMWAKLCKKRIYGLALARWWWRFGGQMANSSAAPVGILCCNRGICFYAWEHLSNYGG